MRKNSLLYSDHNDIDIEEPIEHEPPQSDRSWLFYLIITANSLLVLFVLGIIWFLFLKSPDFQIKELTDKFFGNDTAISSQTLDSPQSPQTPDVDKKTDIVQTPSKQEQEEVQQIRLKKMREQEEVRAERQRLEKIRTEIEAERIKAESIKQTIEQNTANSAKTSTPTLTADQAIPIAAPSSEKPEAEATPQTEDLQTTAQDETITKKEATIIPNAASETLIPQTNTTNTQMDQIMETMRQQQQEKEASDKPLNDSRAPDVQPKTQSEKKLTTNSEPTINHRLIEQQLEALIKTEELKSEAGELLRQAEELDKKIRINQKLSILQANAV